MLLNYPEPYCKGPLGSKTALQNLRTRMSWYYRFFHLKKGEKINQSLILDPKCSDHII